MSAWLTGDEVSAPAAFGASTAALLLAYLAVKTTIETVDQVNVSASSVMWAVMLSSGLAAIAVWLLQRADLVWGKATGVALLAVFRLLLDVVLLRLFGRVIEADTARPDAQARVSWLAAASAAGMSLLALLGAFAVAAVTF